MWLLDSPTLIYCRRSPVELIGTPTKTALGLLCAPTVSSLTLPHFYVVSCAVRLVLLFLQYVIHVWPWITENKRLIVLLLSPFPG
jgi:hypothetical protein